MSNTLATRNGGGEIQRQEVQALGEAKISGVYRIRCLANAKAYIGSSGDVRRQWRSHIKALSHGRHHSRYLQRAWRKYGPAQFVFEMLKVVPMKADLLREEQEYLDLFRTFDREKGYNVYPVAGSRLGVSFTPEERQRISDATRRAYADPECKKRTSEASKKRWADQACRDKYLDGSRRRWARAE